MPIYFKVEFHCDSCGADIVYEDEPPKIIKDRNAVVENNRAIKWFEKHRNEIFHEYVEEIPSNVLLVRRPYTITDYQPQLSLSKTKYIVCTVCSERIYL